MQISVFDVLGPVMIGPSSSHTAGAVKLARVAAQIANHPFEMVSFGMSGSFAKTGQGHGTHKALLAGALGFEEDDERIRIVEQTARQRGIAATYYSEDLDWMHENSVHITFFHIDGKKSEVWGSSLGGGRICIRRIGRVDVAIQAEAPTLVVLHRDKPGLVSQVSQALAEEGINIAVMRLAREGRGQKATIVIEVDGALPPEIAKKLRGIQHVLEVILIDLPQL